MPAPQAVRRWVLTGAVTAITVTGSIYGAGLKSRQEVKQERQRLLQASPEEMIAQLNVARSELVGKKNELERKIANFKAKRLEEALQEKRGTK